MTDPNAVVVVAAAVEMGLLHEAALAVDIKEIAIAAAVAQVVDQAPDLVTDRIVRNLQREPVAQKDVQRDALRDVINLAKRHPGIVATAGLDKKAVRVRVTTIIEILTQGPRLRVHDQAVAVRNQADHEQGLSQVLQNQQRKKELYKR